MALERVRNWDEVLLEKIHETAERNGARKVGDKPENVVLTMSETDALDLWAWLSRTRKVYEIMEDVDI